MRIGQSTDVHELVAGRPLILGGIEIPHDRGLLGHSDADVLLHAVAEAIIGALGLGDLGEHFPDTAAEHKDLASSRIILYVKDLLQEAGFRIVNVDTLVMCEAPKLLPYKKEMKQNIARLLDVNEGQINVKATRGEGLGFIGREEGILAQAVVLLAKNA